MHPGGVSDKLHRRHAPWPHHSIYLSHLVTVAVPLVGSVAPVGVGPEIEATCGAAHDWFASRIVPHNEPTPGSGRGWACGRRGELRADRCWCSLSEAANSVTSMSDPSYHLSKHERAEMMRAHAGLVTALIAKDDDALDAQLKAILADHVAASNGVVKNFAGRMGKQVEAGALVTRHLLMSLAPRLGMSESETLQLIAETYASDDITEDMPD